MDNLTDNKKISNVVYINYLNSILFLMSSIAYIITLFTDFQGLENILIYIAVLISITAYFSLIMIVVNFSALTYSLIKGEDDLIKSVLTICLMIQPTILFIFSIFSI